MNKLISILLLAALFGCKGKNVETNTYPAFETRNMDTTINPGDDFFTYTNGTWIKNNPIPPDKNALSVFNELADRNRDNIREIIMEAASAKDVTEGSLSDKIGKFFNSGMDTLSIESENIKPVKFLFDKIDSLQTSDDVLKLASYFQVYQISPVFYLFADLDAKNSKRVIAQLYQGGLGLPDRDYYFNTDAATVKIREEYITHLTKMFQLLNDNYDVAARNAETIMELETRLAKASFTNVENQDPQKTYNIYDIVGLNKLTPKINWTTFLANTGYPQIAEINVFQPTFFIELNKMVEDVAVDDWKTYFRWNVINELSQYLNKDFVDQNFAFYNTILSGQEKMEPRWKIVLDETSGALGESIGQLYVSKYFPPEAKERMTILVSNLKESLKQRIQGLSWMGPETKQEALAKLENMKVKIGYPDKWRDYSGLEISSQPYVLNVLNSNAFEFKYSMDRVGKPVDPNEWEMTPQTVNAYYHPYRNEIVFPAGILQPPFFNLNADDAVNYGGVGMVIGHEMLHGFDNSGRQFDKDGNLRDWWTKEDSEAFVKRTAGLIEQYNGYEVLDSTYVNGTLTLGENIADLGGMIIALNAYKLSLGGNPSPEKIDGFTDVQRFFLSYGQIWRMNMREEELRRRVMIDVHSPARFRVNGVVYNIPEFYGAFPEVTVEGKLYIPEDKRAVVW
ncbi:MAG TPA: M13 family metallopeptidase [Bacteroidales bacterium]|nr:M13 family metallopeptidase [Bacteroidales bacterium]